VFNSADGRPASTLLRVVVLVLGLSTGSGIAREQAGSGQALGLWTAVAAFDRVLARFDFLLKIAAGVALADIAFALVVALRLSVRHLDHPCGSAGPVGCSPGEGISISGIGGAISGGAGVGRAGWLGSGGGLGGGVSGGGLVAMMGFLFSINAAAAP